VLPVHLAFQAMVGLGTLLAGLAAWATWLAWRRRIFENRTLLRALVVATPLGVVALEAGWMVTELGRQPWIIQGVMRTGQAVTPMPGLAVSLSVITLIYLVLGAVVTVVIRRHVADTRPGAA
jgi:cytochrome d ubiquinol oxidase subunit I